MAPSLPKKDPTLYQKPSYDGNRFKAPPRVKSTGKQKGMIRLSLDTETCTVAPNMDQVLLQNACPSMRPQLPTTNTEAPEKIDPYANDLSTWYKDLQQNKYGQPPSNSHFRSGKFRWTEKSVHPTSCDGNVDCSKKKFINPFSTRKKKTLSGGNKRKIVEKWAKMWDSALSDLQFDRIVFENNPDADQTYKNDKDRINDGCRKLWAIAKMNQNIITMMMKKFVSGPPNKLYTLNRIEAAQCWSRIVDDNGLVREECCVDLPYQSRRKFKVRSMKKPAALEQNPGVMRKSITYKLPEEVISESMTPRSRSRSRQTEPELCIAQSDSKGHSKKSSTYWLDPTVVPPVPEGFKDEDFTIDPREDPTGEIRRDLMKAKEIAKRYTRFAHIIEKAQQVVPNVERVNRLMDENFVDSDPMVRRQTLLQNFFSSQKIETSPDFHRDALYATILSRNDNPKEAEKKPYPYNLAEIAKSKSKTKTRS